MTDFSKLQALSAIRDDRTLDAKERLVLLMLVTHTDKAGQCYPSARVLAAETGLSERSVASALTSLRSRGDATPVRVQSQARGKPRPGGGRPPNLYQLTVGFPATSAENPRPDSLQALQETAESSAPEFPANAEGVSCKTRGEFPAPVALEAVHEAVHEAVQRESAREEHGWGLAPPGEPEDVPETVTPKPKAKRAKRTAWRVVPDDWAPNAAHRQRAVELGLDLDREVEKFRKHDFDKPKKDPDRTFAAWLLRAEDFKRGRGRPVAQAGPVDDSRERAAAEAQFG